MRSTGVPSGRVGLNLELDVPPGQVAALAKALHEFMPSTRSQVGCLGRSAGTRVGNRVTIGLDWDWDSEESLKRHVRSRRVTVPPDLLESALDPRRIAFVLPGGRRGIDKAEEVRRTGEERGAKELLAIRRSDQAACGAERTPATEAG